MSPIQLKRWLWALGLFGGVVGVIAVVAGLGTLLDMVAKARQVDSALNLTLPRRGAEGRLRWLADDPGGPRPLEPFVREQLGNDYLLGFEELTFALRTGSSSGLRSYFQEGALADAELATGAPERALFLDDAHHLSLVFYAPDGATVSFRDDYRYCHAVLAASGQEAVRHGRRSVAVVAALDDGVWRTHHWRVLSDEAQADRTGLCAPRTSGDEHPVDEYSGENP